MSNSGYSVDDILEEIRRKKQNAASEAVKKPSEEKPAPAANSGDFFEMRQKNIVPEQPKEDEAPTYTKKFRSEPTTTRTIQVDDTLSQYFGPTEWKNGKKPKEQKNPISSKVQTVPAHEVKKEGTEDFAFDVTNKKPEKTVTEKPENGFSKTVEAPENKESEIQEAAPAKNQEEEKIVGFAQKKDQPKADEQTEKEPEPAEDLTASKNRDLYKEFTEKRRDKVKEFMEQVAEPTDQEIHIPEIPVAEPVKNKFSEKSNREIAKELMEDMHQPEEVEPDDYDDVSQTEAVAKNLSSQVTSLIIRLAILVILLIASLSLCLSPLLGYPLPEFIAYSKDSFIFPAVNLGIVCIAALTCHVAVGGGLLSLIRFRAGNDSFAACSVLGSVALGILFIADPSAMSAGGENLLFPITLFGLICNTVGKILSASRIKKNFEVLTAGGKKSALLPVHNKELARELTGQRDEVPRFCTSTRANFFTRFLELSYRDDATESIARTVAPLVLCGSILVGIVSFFLNVSIADSIIGFAAALCVASPFSATLAGALPVFRSCAALNEQGSVMAGGYTAETFAETDSVLLDIEQLFPDGSIVLHGIKTFSQGRIDEAILDAASVICSTRNTLESIFMNVVQGDRKLLKPVDTIIYEDGMGLSAWVGGKRVLIGNRELMINHGIDIPSHDYENKYVGVGKDILYLANSGELTAMFVLSYHADKDVSRSLGIMAERGVRLVINCSDPNITIEKLVKLFGYPKSQLKLLSSKYQQKCAELTQERETAPAAAVYNGNLNELSDLINCCGIIRQSSFTAALLELVEILLGFGLVAFFLFTGNITSLGMYMLLGFQLFWFIAITLVVMIRKKI